MITLENVKAYTTSKNNIEVILNGEYTTNGKVLNGRQRYEDANGKVFWVPSCKLDDELHYDVVESSDSEAKDFFSSITEEKSSNDYTKEFFVSITDTDESVVPEPAPESEPEMVVEPPYPIYHTVKRGDSIESIAAQYNVPRTNIASKGSLYIGRKIQVNG